MEPVFLAYDPLLRRNVALKFVRGEDPDPARRFLSEARAQARVRHERVCEVYEAGEVRGRGYIAMRYVDGQTLEQKVLALRQAAEGVHAAHRRPHPPRHQARQPPGGAHRGRRARALCHGLRPGARGA